MSKITFKLRFPSKDIRKWASKYEYQNEQEIVGNVSPVIRKQGHLTKSQFLALCKWKSPRTKGHCERNEEDYIKVVTHSALSSNNERYRIEVLSILTGASWPTASTILHFCAKKPYPILDFRALWSLKTDVPNKYDFEFWFAYTKFCRKLAKDQKIDMRTLDRALWQYSKANQIIGK